MKPGKNAHRLKTESEPFIAIWNGQKSFELRREDTRTFNVGDALILAEWRDDKFTGSEIRATVTYLLRGPAYAALPAGSVIMSIAVNDGFLVLSNGRKVNYLAHVIE